MSARMFVGPAIEGRAVTQADLDGMTEMRGLSVGRVWVDEMQGDDVRDERADEARRIAAEREEADRRSKDEALMARMNRRDRRRYKREGRWW